MIKLTFLGDIMCDNSMAERLSCYRGQDGEYNFHSVFEHVKPILNHSDYVFGNLETPISADLKDLTKKQWEFNSPISFARAVKGCGVDFVSTANNHCLDRGLDGLQSTLSCLNAIGLNHCGIQGERDKNFRVITVQGIRIGILAYTYGTNAFSNHNYLPLKSFRTVNLLQEQEGWTERAWRKLFHGHLIWAYNKLAHLLFPNNTGKQVYEKETLSFYRRWLIRRDIRRIKKEKVDIVIALLHVGGQYNKEPSQYTVHIIDWFLNQGCSVVIGNHEHVVHGVRIKDNKIATYALGNFLGSAGVTKAPFDRLSEYSIALHVNLDEDNKNLVSASFSVFKTICCDDGKYEVWECSDLYSHYNGEEKQRLIEDVQKVEYLFAHQTYEDIRQEFPITL